MHRMLSTRSGVLRSNDVAIPKVVKSAKSSSFAPVRESKRSEQSVSLCCYCITFIL